MERYPVSKEGDGALNFFFNEGLKMRFELEHRFGEESDHFSTGLVVSA